jgi:ribosomal protein L16 Arg81 hydroxylase
MGDIQNFADLIYPISEKEFFSDYYMKNHIHIKSEDKNKLQNIMTWSKLNDLLNMSAFWTPSNLKLFLDTNPISITDYCEGLGDSGSKESLRPSPQKVNYWLSRGASIVANDVDTLSSGLRKAADILEAELSGKVQSNLYCSWQQHQAFPVHMDSHDVFALHVEGEKVWRIYEGKIDEPINHPAFNQINTKNAGSMAGDLLDEITLRPGDILYIPRGVFHEALASTEGCIHLSFGVTHVIGYDVLALLLEKALEDPEFRKNMPRASSPEEQKRAWINSLGSKTLSILKSEVFYQSISTYQNNFKYFRGGFNLPNIKNKNKLNQEFEICFDDFEIQFSNGECFLQRGNTQVNIPNDITALVEWVIKKKNFTMDDLLKNFGFIKDDRIHFALVNLQKMNVLREKY